jgi:colanic acid/amylovoran biosynthesis protein
MGGLTSAFPEYARMLLDSIELAAAHGVRIVLFGQGIGPLDDELTSRARQVLPKVDFIGLREGCFGPPLLRSFQVPDDRIFVTGDDAIEIAFRRRRDDLQRAIGINVRTANYSGVDPDFLPRLRGPVLSAAQALGAPLVPVPISALGGEEDMNAIASLLGSSNSAVAVDQSTGIHLQAIERIQQCRMVITGSYHAGVFALAQGISVVGLAANAYYLWKFRGLAHQFGEGCAVVALNEPGAFDLLERLIESTWSGAERLRPALLAAAERQVGQSRAAYQRVYERIAHDGQRPK